ncbi:hypothetical protein PLICRDRAFT_50020 [Plicaturopsis crispa FD-325 SS-3]|nr:hypothetical protein PLICRDRAFT_50020 [Plicaturopsis crispa FD-325 SS-3]
MTLRYSANSTRDTLLDELSPRERERALAISPNLEALLEHDERSRQSLFAPTEPTTGLRPAPRGPKKTRSRPVTPRDSLLDNERRPGSSGSATNSKRSGSQDRPSSLRGSSPTTLGSANPYINPPPFVDGSLYNRRDSGFMETRASPVHSLSPTSARATSQNSEFKLGQSSPVSPANRYSNIGHTSSSATSSLSSPPPKDTPRRSSIPDSQQSPASQHQHIRPVAPRFLTGHQALQSLPALDTSGVMQKPGRTTDPRYTVSSSSKELASSSQDKSRTSQPDIAPSPSQRSRSAAAATRPLISHDSRTSEDSSRSTDSSLSSYGPPSTDSEPRISVSSTIYRASLSSHSLPAQLSLPPFAPSDDLMPSFEYPMGSASPSRESFIELSPESPEFSRFTKDSDESTTARLTDTYPNRPTNPLTSSKSTPYPNSAPVNPETHTASLQQPSQKPSKPPVPTTPKPTFVRNSVMSTNSPRPPPNYPAPSLPSTETKSREHRLSTTNQLGADERAELVRKTRKLAQVFGQTPSASAVSARNDGDSVPSLLHPFTGKQSHHRTATAMPDIGAGSSASRPFVNTKPSWPPHEGTTHVSASGRRHSSPLTSEGFAGLQNIGEVLRGSEDEPVIEIGAQAGGPNIDWRDRLASKRSGSPTSFIDLSDEDNDDNVSAIVFADNHNGKRSRAFPHSPSSPSFFDTEPISAEEQQELDRKRKRDKLAKLHRFLGSRVPVDLVLGVEPLAASLPPFAPVDLPGSVSPPLGPVLEEGAYMRRRRSSSSAAFPSTYLGDTERLKEDLDEKEKAINVKRAQKMERVFGVLPPQTLYHTRQYPSPSPALDLATARAVPSPITPVHSSPPSPVRNRNQSSYYKGKRNARPGTSESSQHLINGRESVDMDADRRASVFMHYSQSLHSLNDIITRDDKASLAELHQYLAGSITDPVEDRVGGSPERRVSNASIKSDRRRSLPARTSSMSLNSEYNLTSPKPEATDFQLRRRRAAKLTHFFGVDYRDLIQDVLDSIEKGVEEESKRGTLSQHEVADLLKKLRTLKTKRTGMY